MFLGNSLVCETLVETQFFLDVLPIFFSIYCVLLGTVLQLQIALT